MTIPLWAGKYIGLPFNVKGRDQRGVDCWGLVRLVTSEQAGYVLPSFNTQYDGITTQGDISKIGAHIRSVLPHWEIVDNGMEKCFDVIVLRMNGQPMHVGIVIGDGHMLHIERGINSCIESYRSMRWKDRIYGFYRHATQEY
jgi:cell wall-associated NlpC family hydrolase